MKCRNCGKESNINCLCGVCMECNSREGHDVIFKKFGYDKDSIKRIQNHDKRSMKK